MMPSVGGVARADVLGGGEGAGVQVGPLRKDHCLHRTRGVSGISAREGDFAGSIAGGWGRDYTRGRERIYKLQTMTTTATEAVDGVAATLAAIHTESGANLLALAEASPVLLVFLRHFGCPFCRKTISDVAGLQQELADRGVRPVFVHLGTPEIAQKHFDYYGLGGVERIHDRGAAIYQQPAFALSRQHPLLSTLHPAVFWVWLKRAVGKHGIGKIQGDGHQMPGIFFLKGPKIVRRFVHRHIADEPDYLDLVR
jgi:thiol-disulfide isomerase/thioredoxin